MFFLGGTQHNPVPILVMQLNSKEPDSNSSELRQISMSSDQGMRWNVSHHCEVHVLTQNIMVDHNMCEFYLISIMSQHFFGILTKKNNRTGFYLFENEELLSQWASVNGHNYLNHPWRIPL